ncbi:MAG: copper amine oxidase N-terminal domain-containing protein [Defluviitaleaceae bacterium]|nr:copper amine oxidase N-terminal domain-containing protein [Defluviitaleaceae bacterium]
MKKFSALLLMVALMAIPVFAEDAIGVSINGEPVVFDGQGPVTVDGRTLVPVRGVFEHLGFDVSWDDDSQSAILYRADFYVTIPIGDDTFTVNGQSFALDVPAQTIGGRTMIPLRAVLQSVGYSLEWDDATNTVLISSGVIAVLDVPSVLVPMPGNIEPPETEITACFGESSEGEFVSCFVEPASGVIHLAETNVTGAAAIPIAYDVYRQFLELLRDGFDADFERITEMDVSFNMHTTAVYIDDFPFMGLLIEELGNMRQNRSGDLVRMAVTTYANVLLDVFVITESLSLLMEKYIEMYDGEVLFAHMVEDGRVLDEEWYEVFSMGVDIPTIEIESISSAEISRVNDEIWVEIALNTSDAIDFASNDAAELSDFAISELQYALDLVLGPDTNSNVDFAFTTFKVVLDSDGILLYMSLITDMVLSMELDIGEGKTANLTAYASVRFSYTFNYIGFAEIDMPSIAV